MIKQLPVEITTVVYSRKRKCSRKLIASLCLFAVFMGTSKSWALSEEEKITMLLSAVEQSGLIFIRNGREYPSGQARSHLEYKYSRTRGRIKTAGQFIRYIATKSSLTGRIYLIKQKNGKIIPSSVWLKDKLAEIEKQTP